MKYYNLLIVYYVDGTSDKTSLYTYASSDESLSAYYSTLGGYINKDNISHVMCMRTNSNGVILGITTWDKETEDTTDTVTEN